MTVPEPGSSLVGNHFDVEVGPVAHGGHFVARHEGRVIFVRHALPGEQVTVEITEDSGRFLRGDAIHIASASPHRVQAPCPSRTPAGVAAATSSTLSPGSSAS